MAAIVFSIFFYDETTPFPSVYALVPVLGVVLLILYAEKKTIVARLLSTKVFVGVGLISYSAYLWHQPLFAFARIRIYQPSEIIFVLLSITSIVLAYVTWRYIETPFRGKNPLLNNKILIFLSTLTLICAFALIGFIGHAKNGYDSIDDLRLRLSELEKRMVINRGISDTCEGEFTLSNDCSTSQDPEVLLWGDSFAMHLYQGINASKSELKLRQITMSGCAPILGITRIDFLNRDYNWANRCIEFNDNAFEWLKTSKSVQFVVLSSSNFFNWAEKDKILDRNGKIYEKNLEFIMNKFKETVQKIHNLGVGVIVVSSTPRSEENIGDCLVKKYQFNSTIDCNFNLSKIKNSYEHLRNVSNFVPVYWLYKDICQKKACSAEIEGNFIYRDTGHLSKEGSSLLGKRNNWFDKFKNLAIRGIGHSN